jgi:ribosomal protein L37E
VITNNVGQVVDESTAIQLCKILGIYKDGMDGTDCIITLDSVTSSCSECHLPTYTVNGGCVDCKFPKEQSLHEICNSCGMPSLFYKDGTCANCGV